MSERVTAALVVIGDEILSGRTKDRNIGHLADMLTAVGIDLREVRVVSDDRPAIVEAVNQLRARNTYLFTTGGIGPTHDDITAEAISAAFGLPCEQDAKAYALLEAHYTARGIDFTEARKRMTRMPRGAVHIDNPISIAPGFRIENVYVMAGVPAIFQAMLDNVIPTLRTGARMMSHTIPSDWPEGTIGGPLGEVQAAHPDTVIGSYPKIQDKRFWTEIVVRSTDEAALNAAVEAVQSMLRDMQPNEPAIR